MIEVKAKHDLGGFALNAEFVADGRFIALFGPSGAGKTMVINIIAGLLRAREAYVAINGTVLADTARGIFLPTHRRRLGYVFQEGRLFPHLTVQQNLLYGAWFGRSSIGSSELERVTKLLGIEHLLHRHPSSLSGGEKQRVAIGRALLASPKLLLMDEPLASLDEQRKQEIIPYLERLRDEAHIPVIYVSHSVAEVARLSDTLVILANGRVTATGPTIELMQRLDLIVPEAGFEEAGAVIEATVQNHDDGYSLTTLTSRAGEWKVPRLPIPPGRSVRMRIKARDITIALQPPEGISALNVIPGVIEEIGLPAGSTMEIKLNCKGEALVLSLTRYSAERLSLQIGMPVFAIVKSVSFDKTSVGVRSSENRETH